jgi:DNA-directed RNA polymerase specialized sigma24 family protein
MKNPLNIHYKNVVYEDCAHSKNPDLMSDDIEDHIYENNMGLPDISWISGENCSDAFSTLTPEERKILIKYYLENMCDRQIAEYYDMHLNTCNQKRRQALFKLAKKMGYSRKDIRRSRNSGRNAF